MAQKKFEDAMTRLEDIVEDLETGDLPLEDSIKVFEEGMKLVNFCSEKLEQADKKVSMLVKEGDNKYSTQPQKLIIRINLSLKRLSKCPRGYYIIPVNIVTFCV